MVGPSPLLWTVRGPRVWGFPDLDLSERRITWAVGELILDDAGDVLRAGIDLVKGRDVVQILVVKAFQDRIQELLDFSKIDGKPQDVEFSRLERDDDLVTMAMDVLAFASVAAQRVGRLEMATDVRAVQAGVPLSMSRRERLHHKAHAPRLQKAWMKMHRPGVSVAL